MRILGLVAAVLTLCALILVAGCGDDDSPSSGGSSPGIEADPDPDPDPEAEATTFVDPSAPVVEATLNEWSIQLSKTSAAAGRVTFRASNKGTEPHELVVIKADVSPGALVTDGKLVDEDRYTSLGEIEEFAAGGQEAATFQLARGSYILFCNVEEHYQKGMRIAFKVE